MKNVALTGNVAAGKSAVARRWEELGVPVLKSDDVARGVVERGTSGLRQVTEAFGEEVLRADGSLDRDRLRALVARDREARRRLEGILHPLIEEERRRWLEEQEAAGRELAVSEIPLLFEVGLQDEFDVVVFVDAPEEMRLERVVRDRGVSRGEARALLAMQDPPGPKRRAADHVIENDGSLDELRSRAEGVLEALRAGEGGKGGEDDARGAR